MINLVQGFDIGAGLPIDGRVLLSKNEMKEISDNILPEKYFAISRDDGKLYLYDKNNAYSDGVETDNRKQYGKFRLADSTLLRMLLGDQWYEREQQYLEGIGIVDSIYEDIDIDVDDINERITEEVQTLNNTINTKERALYNEVDRLDLKIDHYKEDKDLVDGTELATILEDYALGDEAGRYVSLTMDTNFNLRLSLKDRDHNEIDFSSVDLPLEQMVIDADYDEDRQMIILHIKGPESSEVKDIEIPLGALISDLVSKEDFRNHVENSDVHVRPGERERWNEAAQDAITPSTFGDYLLAGENVELNRNEVTGKVEVSAKDTIYYEGTGIVINSANEISTSAAAPYWDLIQGGEESSESSEEYNPRGPLTNAALKRTFDEFNNNLQTQIDESHEQLSGEIEALSTEVNEDIQELRDTKQNNITVSNKLQSDLVDDSGTNVNKFVTNTDKGRWDAKQNALNNQTPYSEKGSATKVPKLSTNEWGQVTAIEEVDITHPRVGDATFTFKQNGSTIGQITANQEQDAEINVTIPTKVSEFTNDSNYQSGDQVNASIAAHNTSNAAHEDIRALITANTDEIEDINEKIPNEASASNQLADKEFVNSSIATNTATFRGTFESEGDLPTKSQVSDLKDNDYAFVIQATAQGNPEYRRYKYGSNSWSYEYTLNNSSFTAEQWSAINSGITKELIPTNATSANKFATANDVSSVAGDVSALSTSKQDKLVSGTNIKTINGNTLLNNGNLEVGTFRSITLSGDDRIGVNPSTSGSAYSAAFTHKISGVTAGNYGESSSGSSVNPGGQLHIPYITVNDTGHITSAETKNIAIPTTASGRGLDVYNGGFGVFYKDENLVLAADGWSARGISEASDADTIYVQEINVDGINENSHPTLDVNLSSASSLGDIDALNEAWSKIYRAETGSGIITFYATEQPSVAIPVIIKG